ncbi:unnamed protein product [Cyprideis torosa]|uniref:glutaminase n=1 Tax=Cyprideis torosa TaxID=163714 RepID=A0A7R8W871_9CRUS|nr:unnamed protein product [Cyprideis torosa]CAG0882908.1 unnamed protein product [Cyprideis torosa]
MRHASQVSRTVSRLLLQGGGRSVSTSVFRPSEIPDEGTRNTMQLRRNSAVRFLNQDIASSDQNISAASPQRYSEVPESVADLLFDIFASPTTNRVSMGRFLRAVRETGLRASDPRLRETMENLRRMSRECGLDSSLKEAMDVDREQFRRVIQENVVILSRAFRHQFRIPDFQSFSQQIEDIYWRCKDIDGGKVASYIPQLARYARDNWGISLCTIDGQRLSLGDVKLPFTIQSCSKPLTYGLALNEVGSEEVHRFVGQEPSGRMFNAMVLDHNRKPHNPMINAGAIIICAILQGLYKPEMSLSEKFDLVQNYFRRLAGDEYIGFNNSVFLSERDAADRNFALGYFMKEHKCFPPNVTLKDTLDFYFQAVRETGLRASDPRLRETMENLRRMSRECGLDSSLKEAMDVDREQFRRVIQENVVILSRAFRHQFRIPDFQSFSQQIEDIYWRCKDIDGGKVASYIPQLARYARDNWGISLCTIDGQRLSLGDVKLPFTIQSCSKPLTYGLALNEVGSEEVHRFVGQEPSGRMFNAMVLDHNRKPHNPMINAGAIIICAILQGLYKPEMSLSEKFDLVQNYFRRLAGDEYIGFNNSVFLSERDAADRNFALGYFMKEHKCFPPNVTLKDTLDFYFQCCSLESNCESMAVMAGTLANGGICPTTGEKILDPASVRDVLSLMHSCGMYDYSGQFAFHVGLPAKSGVSGALLVVVPTVMGLCLWSPPLDSCGNSVRGLQFCKEVSLMFFLGAAAAKLRKGIDIVNLIFASAAGDVSSLRRFYLQGTNMSSSDYDSRTPLHLAACEGHLECVEFLINVCGVTPDPKDRWNSSPLDDARRMGHGKVVAFLEEVIKARDADSEDKHGPENQNESTPSSYQNVQSQQSRQETEDSWFENSEDFKNNVPSKSPTSQERPQEFMYQVLSPSGAGPLPPPPSSAVVSPLTR